MMTEVETGSVEVFPEASGPGSCDPPSCPSLSPCLPCCTNEDGEEGHHDNRKIEHQKRGCNQGQPKRRAKAKGKLVRSMAVCEETPDYTQDSQGPVEAPLSSLSGYHDDEGTSCKEDEQENTKDPKTPTLTKDASLEYTDSTGIDLRQFILSTLNSNPRDRLMLLKLEQEMITFITNNSPYKKFPHMSSYHRMLVHRVAAYFGMEHNVDQTGKAVIINKTSNTRIPEQRFIEEVQEEKGEETQWRTILKRDTSEDQARLHPLHAERRSKSMEEREEEYQRARDRIFNQEPVCSQDSVYVETRAVEECNPYAETQRRRQLFRGSRDGSGSSRTGSSRQSSTEMDCRYGNDPRPWSSTDSDSSYQRPGPAPKPRHAPNPSWDSRGTGSITLSRVVPSTYACPSPPPLQPEPAPTTNPAYILLENGIPPGSILMNPQTGQPFLNPDGSPAVYNPPEPQQPIRGQPQQQVPPPQQQQQQQPMAGHSIPQVVQYSSVSYPPQQMVPVSPSQHYSASEDLSSQFGHVTLGCQSSGEAPPLYPPPQAYVYTAPPLPPPTHNPPGYCQPQPQVPLYYYSGQYPTSAPQQCRPPTPPQLSHSQATQPTGYSPVISNQQQGYQGMMGVQPPQSQAQSMLGTYPVVPSNSCGVVQGGVAVSYSQSGLLSGVGGEGGYCCLVPPPPCGPMPPMPPPLHTSCHPSNCANISSQGWGGKY